MPEGYWGDQVNPKNDDFDLWLNIEPEQEQQGDEDDDATDYEMDEQFNDLDSIIEEIGPPAVLEAVSAFLYDLERPYHRIAKQVLHLAKRTVRTITAVEEARQTRGR